MRQTKDKIREELIQYCNDVIENKIVSCKKHKWACMRFLRDLERENTEEFPYLFNPALKFPNGEDENGDPIYEKKRPADRYFDWTHLFKHRKGELEGQFKELVPYEKFVYGNIYGWVRRDNFRRRFKRSYEQVGRKNAKSQDKAIQVLYEISAFGEMAAEAYVAASNKGQTRHVWGEAKWLVENTPEIRDKFVIKFDQELQAVIIRHKKSGGFFARLSKDDKKVGDGANPSFWILDEYHLQETTEYYDIGVSGFKTRTQPLLSIITTAGFELNNPCYTVEYEYIKKLLNPDIDVENEHYFAIVCELEVDEETGQLLDDINDEKVWPKSNPVIGDTEIGRESIRIDLAEAKDKPEKMRDTLTKTFNIWVNQRAAGYMNLDKWKTCQVIIEVRPFPEIIGKRAFLGLDLSSRLDLTSLGADIPLDEDNYAVMQHSFMPAEMFEYKMKTDTVRYDLWLKKGLLTLTDGAEVDYHFVLNYLVDWFEMYKWPKDESEVCFDQAMATWLEHEITNLGYKALAVPQTYTGISESLKDFRNKAYGQKIFFDDPMLTWAVSNAIVRKGPSENILLDKGKVKQRIDPLACLITAHSRAMIHEKITKSIYETRASFKL